MSREENQQLVERFVQAFWNQGQTTAADELITADAQIYLPGQGQVDKESFKGFATALRKAFPDWHSTFEDFIIEGDRVVERWTGRGTQQGPFQGMPASGKQVTVPGFVYYRIVNGRIAEFRGLLDEFMMLQQLGAIPAAQHAGK